ncbi:MAG: hypothetical protein ABIF82_11025 [Planctomycetota bacterium]
MKKQQQQRPCRHKLSRSCSVQRLGTQPPLGIRQCVICHSTVSAPLDGRSGQPQPAAMR